MCGPGWSQSCVRAEGVHHHGEAGWALLGFPSWEGGRGQQGSGQPEEVASAGPRSSPVDLLPFLPELLLKTRQNQETSEPPPIQHRSVCESEKQGSSETILQEAATTCSGSNNIWAQRSFTQMQG